MSRNYPKIPEVIVQFIRAISQKYSIPRWIVFIFDNLSVFLVFLLAYLLRFNFVLNDFTFETAFHHSLLVFLVYTFFSLVFRSYSGLLRHTTIMDIVIVLLGTTCSFVVLTFLSLLGRELAINVTYIVPVSILIIHYVTLTVFLFLIRITIKMVYLYISSSFDQKKKVLIYGAGVMGIAVKRAIQSDQQSKYQIIGFLDNDKKIQGKKLNGLQVYNPKVLCENFMEKKEINTLIFAIKDIDSEEKKNILKSLFNLGLEVLEAPAVELWIDGQLRIDQIQKVKLEDLLGRDPIKLNIEKIREGLSDKTILVTGAAGSIGSEIVRQLTRFDIKQLILVDMAETPMFHLKNELAKMENSFEIHPILTDITNPSFMDCIFKKYRPEVIFHAAAYKHVPLMEENPHEAIRVNMGGTMVLTDLANKYGVNKFVMISTDKAVNPTNVMGASKRACELIVKLRANLPGNKTQFVITRFGNVLGSNGSVIPIFTKQIQEGGPVTVTHPDITRYFMTIPEACQLVLEAGFMGKENEIFVFDMGKPVKIVDLAKQMIRLSGMIPDKDIKITYVGLRPGEKMFEELLGNKENTLSTHHPKIQIANVSGAITKDQVKKIENTFTNLYCLSNEEVIEFLQEIVPEYKPSKNLNGAANNHLIKENKKITAINN